MFLFCPRVLGHLEASGRGSQGEKLLFWGGQYGGARTGTASPDEAEASKNAGRGNLARSCAQDRRADQDNDVPRRSPSGFVGADDDYDQPEEPTPVRNAAGIELVGKRKKPMNWVKLGVVKLAVVCQWGVPAHLDQGNMAQLETGGGDKTFRRLL